MKFFTWLNGEPETEVQRAIRILSKQNRCSMFALGEKLETCNHFMVGNIKKSWLWKKAWFDHYDVKFSKTGNEAMISKRGSVDFFFATKKEVDALRQSIINRFK